MLLESMGKDIKIFSNHLIVMIQLINTTQGSFPILWVLQKYNWSQNSKWLINFNNKVIKLCKVESTTVQENGYFHLFKGQLEILPKNCLRLNGKV